MNAPALASSTGSDYDGCNGQLQYGPFGFVVSCDDSSVNWSLLGNIPHTYIHFFPPPDDQSICLSRSSSCVLLSSCASYTTVNWQLLGPLPSVSVARVASTMTFDFHPSTPSPTGGLYDASSLDVTMVDVASSPSDDDAKPTWTDDNSRYCPINSPSLSFRDPTSVFHFDLASDVSDLVPPPFFCLRWSSYNYHSPFRTHLCSRYRSSVFFLLERLLPP